MLTKEQKQMREFQEISKKIEKVDKTLDNIKAKQEENIKNRCIEDTEVVNQANSKTIGKQLKKLDELMKDRDDEDIKTLKQIKASIAKMEKLNKEQEKALKNILKNKEEENIF